MIYHFLKNYKILSSYKKGFTQDQFESKLNSPNNSQCISPNTKFNRNYFTNFGAETAHKHAVTLYLPIVHSFYAVHKRSQESGTKRILHDKWINCHSNAEEQFLKSNYRPAIQEIYGTWRFVIIMLIRAASGRSLWCNKIPDIKFLSFSPTQLCLLWAATLAFTLHFEKDAH